MADLIAIYNPVKDFTNPDEVLFTLPGTFPWSERENVYHPDFIRDLMRRVNAEAVSTAEAVKVSYLSGTSREQWLQDRINAVNVRVTFIRDRTEGLLTALQSSGSDSYATLSQLVATALSVIPVVGLLASSAKNSAQSAQALNAITNQNLLQGYASELQQLAQIKAQLVKEYTGDSSDANLFSSATPFPTYYYVIGALILIWLLVIIRNRNLNKGRNRR